MGSFSSGTWAILLIVYFLGFFLVTYSIVNGMPDADTSGIQFSDPGFGSTPAADFTVAGQTAADSFGTESPGMSSIMTSLKIMTGINAGSVSIGIPTGWKWLFSFLFFWIPFFALLWAIYMAIPFFH